MSMKKFYEDGITPEECTKMYAGKGMGEIQELERKRFEEKRPEIDEKHEAFAAKSRKRMLTVGKLIAWLLEQDQDACVLAYEPNSDAYIEQLDDLPNYDICTVSKAKKDMEDNLASWYRGTSDVESKIERDISTVFRYAKDNDVIIRFN